MMPTREPDASRPLPSGAVTFAFTDIEGSTRRWERDEAAMRAAVRRHDALVRAAIEERSGYVFKTIGDAFCAAFGQAQDALAAMLEAQRRLAAEDFAAVEGLRVRAAIHTGTADERDGDYFGPTVNRVARLLAIGHGGQVLVSGTSSDLLAERVPAGTAFLDLGEHRLKDLGRPERVFQVIAPDLPRDFPPLASLAALRNNLPLVSTSFVGREPDVAAVAELLRTHRLVTLTGAGGIGKTRTSLQVAANVLDGFGDGVWFVELAPLESGEYIPAVVAKALGVGLASNGDPLENLVRELSGRHMLLVFDNCEHLIEPAARVLSALLRGCPKTRILASSRQGIGIAEEAVYRLPSLGAAAVTLFAERARAADHRFSLTDQNVPAIADICRRLDGIPLAIELAAARVKVLSPERLRERLDERFRVLTGGRRDALPRQQTLRALIDWSHDLLTESERALFRHLSIFANGFALEGAVALGSGPDVDECDVLDLLESLVDKSLVVSEEVENDRRYRLLESTRLYAREKLEAAHEVEAYAERHVRYLRDRFVEARVVDERTARPFALNELLARELEDVRVALDAAASGAHAVLGAELLTSVDSAWRSIGLEREGLERIERFLASHFARSAACEPRVLARLWMTLATFAGDSGRFRQAFEASERAVEHARCCDDPATLADALRQYAQQASRLPLFEQSEAALAEAEALPGCTPSLRLRLLETRANLNKLKGDLDAAALATERLRDANRSLGNEAGARSQTQNLAEIEHERGRTQHAIELIRAVLPEARAYGDRSRLAHGLMNLAGYLVASGEYPEAIVVARDAIRERAERDPGDGIATTALEHLALALALGGELARAARLAGYVDVAQQRLGFQREFTEQTTHDRLHAVLADALDCDEFQRLQRAGAELTPEAAVALGLEES
jgi:predicted ATPase/class 3 adenylate cyclase